MLEGKNNWKAWLYLIPSLLLLGVFSFYPIVNTFIVAFLRDYHPVSNVYQENLEAIHAAGQSVFTFGNFATVLNLPGFKYAILNTAILALISVPVSVIIALLISALLVSIKKLRGFFQTLFFLPYVTSAMAVAMAFTVIFANTGTTADVYPSPVNSVLRAVGLEKPIMKVLDWLHYQESGKKQWCDYLCVELDGETFKIDEETGLREIDIRYQNDKASAGMFGTFPFESAEEYYLYLKSDTATENLHRHKFETLGYIDWVGANASWGSAIIVMLFYSVWSALAFKILVFTGGLTSIDKQYYDAAKVDATSKWRTFWKITVPMMSPLIVYILITSLIGSFKVYTSVVGLFGDTMGPAGAPGSMQTFVGLVYIFTKQGNEAIHLGSAAALILFVIILIVTQLTNMITKKRVHY